MRISDNEIEVIKNLAVRIFGEDTKVFLFGSRIADNKRVGSYLPENYVLKD